MKDSLFVCRRENIDGSLLLPLVILHDVGYAEVPKDNPFKINLRKAHMKAGALMAKIILDKVSYPKSKIKKIVHLVSMHDNWALGEDGIYKKDKLLGVFNDLDFMWMATPKGFPALMKILNKTSMEMVAYLETNEKLARRPFCTKTTKGMFDKYIQARKGEL